MIGRQPGLEDLLLLATDGLFDAMAADGSRVGRELCLQWIVEHRIEPADRIVEELLAATRRFVDGTAIHDDLTIVVAKAN
jgi:serine phosphatase RsbU (regulator of sigma subunit)